LSERSYYHRGVCAWKSLVLRCSLLRQPAGQVRFGPKVVLTRLRSEGMIALNDRRVEFLDLKAMALLAQFQPVRRTGLIGVVTSRLLAAARRTAGGAILAGG
jgi:hypothetical protein